jgi:ribosome-associated protein
VKNIIKLPEEDIVSFAKDCARLFDERKAKDIILLNLMKINSYLDYFLISTANSHMHCRSLAKEAQKFFHASGISERSKSNLDSGWIVLDYNEIVIHVFTQEMREYYQLEKLWADAEQIKY